jgi:hypothetical protein
MIADTILASKAGLPVKNLTGEVSRKYEDISYSLQENEEKSEANDRKQGIESTNDYFIRTRTGGQKPQHAQSEQERNKHQIELRKRK